MFLTRALLYVASWLARERVGGGDGDGGGAGGGGGFWGGILRNSKRWKGCRTSPSCPSCLPVMFYSTRPPLPPSFCLSHAISAVLPFLPTPLVIL